MVRTWMRLEKEQEKLMSESKIWILSISSESGDDFGPFLFRKKPSNQELLDFLRTISPDDCVDEEYEVIEVYDAASDGRPGFSGTYLYIEWSKDTIR